MGCSSSDWGCFSLLSTQCCSSPQDESHSEWVSCVRFSPNSSNPIIVSCGWDKLVKVRGAAPLGFVQRSGEYLSSDHERVGFFLLHISEPVTFTLI